MMKLIASLGGKGETCRENADTTQYIVLSDLGLYLGVREHFRNLVTCMGLHLEVRRIS